MCLPLYLFFFLLVNNCWDLENSRSNWVKFGMSTQVGLGKTYTKNLPQQYFAYLFIF